MYSLMDALRPKNPFGDQSNLPPYAIPMNAVDDPTITVTGEKGKENITPATLNTGMAALLPAQGAPATQNDIDGTQKLQGLPEHKGMFGVKGTLRNVIGMLGDAFLAASGMKPIYAPIRRREELGDRMIGFNSENDQDVRDAINRVTAYDPEAGAALRKQYDDRMEYQGKLEIAKSAAADKAQKDKLVAIDNTRKYAENLLGSVTNEAHLPAALAMIERVATMNGVTLEELGITPNMTPDDRRIYSRGHMNTTQQIQGEQRDRQLDIGQQNADANTVRANRPPQPRAAPNPTNASLAGPLLAKVERGEPLTAGQQEYLDRLGYGKAKGRRGSGRQTSPSTQSTGKLVFRNGKLVPQ